MDGRLEVLRVFEREPNKTFSTSRLVEAVYPQHMRSIREQMQYGDREKKRSSQHFKSKLHRKTLYYVTQLVAEHVLEVVRLDAHGEKIYKISKPTITVNSKSGPVHIHQQALRTHLVEERLEDNSVILFEDAAALSRFNTVYIDCSALDGLGHLTKLLDSALRAVNDVVCLGDFQELLHRYRAEHLNEFLETISIQTLDEAKAVCILIDTRKAPVAEFVRLYASHLPKRVFLVFVCDSKTVVSEPMLSSISYLQERNEKVNVHMVANHAYPLYIGHAGVYGFQKQEWERFRSSSERQPICVVGQATIMLDMGRLGKLPAHEVRTAVLNSAKTLYALASQQGLQKTANQELALMTSSPDVFSTSRTYLRVWNYDWESGSRLLSSIKEELAKLAHLQKAVYHACSLPVHADIQFSSTFAKADKKLTNRAYRKWMITNTNDLHTEAFHAYTSERLHYLDVFGNMDRFRVFRTGSPTAQQIAYEIVELSQRGFPFITYDFESLRGVKKLTEFFV